MSETEVGGGFGSPFAGAGTEAAGGELHPAGASPAPTNGTAPSTGESPPASGEQPPAAAAAGEAPTGSEGPPLAAPADWSPADRERFRGLPRETQQFVLDRTTPTPVQRVAQRWQPYAEELGVGMDTVIDGLMRAEWTLRNGTPAEKRGLIDRITEDYEVPSQEAAVAADPLGVGATIDQALGPIREQLQTLQGATPEPAVQEMNREIEAFRSERGGDGQLLRPHYDEVAGDMNMIAEVRIRQGQPLGTLQELYDTAVWSHPALREKLQEGRREELERRRQALGGLTGAAAGGASTGTMNDTLRELLQ